MKLRLKFLNKFHVFETTAADATLNEIFDSASKCFGLKRDNVEISLNAKDYYNLNDSHQSITKFGIVNGDIIYIRSLEKLDDIKQSLEAELTIPIFSLANNLIASHQQQQQHYTSICFMSIPLYIFAIDKGLHSLDDIHQLYQQISSSSSSIIRLTFNYSQLDSIKIVFTLYENGNMTCIAASVQHHSICKQLILPTKNYLINQNFIDQSVVNKFNFVYKQLRLLAIQIKDELIEPILLAIHSKFDLSPRLHLCTLPMELFAELLHYLPLTSLGSLMLCNHQLHDRIRDCNTIWRIQLMRLNARSYQTPNRRQQSSPSLSSSVDQAQLMKTSLSPTHQSHTNLLHENRQNINKQTEFTTVTAAADNEDNDDDDVINGDEIDLNDRNQTKKDEAYELFLARYKSLLMMQRRRYCIDPRFV